MRVNAHVAPPHSGAEADVRLADAMPQMATEGRPSEITLTGRGMAPARPCSGEVRAGGSDGRRAFLVMLITMGMFVVGGFVVFLFLQGLPILFVFSDGHVGVAQLIGKDPAWAFSLVFVRLLAPIVYILVGIAIAVEISSRVMGWLFKWLDGDAL